MPYVAAIYAVGFISCALLIFAAGYEDWREWPAVTWVRVAFTVVFWPILPVVALLCVAFIVMWALDETGEAYEPRAPY